MRDLQTIVAQNAALSRVPLDYKLEDGGSVILVRPLNDAARENITTNLDGALWFGGALAVDRNLANEFVLALRADGFEVA